MGVFGSIIFFGFLAAVILVPQILKSRDRQRMYDTIRMGYERGQPVPPEMIDLMTRGRSRDIDPITYAPEPSASRDLRRGIVWTAVGVGFVLIGACFYAGLYDVGGAPETFGSFAAIGAIPLCIGLAFLGLWWFGRRNVQGSRVPMSFAEPVAPAPPPASPASPIPNAPAVPRPRSEPKAQAGDGPWGVPSDASPWPPCTTWNWSPFPPGANGRPSVSSPGGTARSCARCCAAWAPMRPPRTTSRRTRSWPPTSASPSSAARGRSRAGCGASQRASI